LRPPSTSSWTASSASLACPSHVHAPPTENPECPPRRASELLLLSPNPGMATTRPGGPRPQRLATVDMELVPKPSISLCGGQVTSRLARCRPGTRSEAEHFVGRQRGFGFPHRPGCPHRPESFAGVCSSVIWASPKPGNSEHTIRPRVCVSQSRALTWAALGTRTEWMQSFASLRSVPSRVVGHHFM
jgi:hypothetical protein